MNSSPAWLRSPARFALGASLLASFLYWIFSILGISSLQVLFKGVAVASLAVIAWQRRRSPQARWLGAALLCHSAGDILLERAEFFMPAVSAFFCGHVLYIAAFRPDVFPLKPLSRVNAFFLLAVIAFALVMGAALVPHLPGPLLLPLLLYMFALSAMATAAVLADYPAKTVMIGAMLYLFSDALIGFNMFVRPTMLNDYFAWPAYYFGQLFITLGFLQRQAP